VSRAMQKFAVQASSASRNPGRPRTLCTRIARRLSARGSHSRLMQRSIALWSTLVPTRCADGRSPDNRCVHGGRAALISGCCRTGRTCSGSITASAEPACPFTRGCPRSPRWFFLRLGVRRGVGPVPNRPAEQLGRSSGVGKRNSRHWRRGTCALNNRGVVLREVFI
jgi:hypothetical protein